MNVELMPGQSAPMTTAMLIILISTAAVVYTIIGAFVGQKVYDKVSYDAEMAGWCAGIFWPVLLLWAPIWFGRWLGGHRG